MISVYCYVLVMRYLFLLFIISCGPHHVSNPDRNTTKDVEYCNDASKKLIELGCKEGKPTKKGLSFYDLCIDLESKGMYINAKCISQIDSCEKIDYCTGSR